MKIDPLIMVPIAVKIGALILPLILFLMNKNKPKNKSAVIGLSIILATCPPGTNVVKADNIPVTIANRTTYLVFGNNIIPKNIIVNNISGFIPNKIAGTTACSTAPIPTSNDKITKTLVFTCISPLLS